MSMEGPTKWNFLQKPEDLKVSYPSLQKQNRLIKINKYLKGQLIKGNYLILRII